MLRFISVLFFLLIWFEIQNISDCSVPLSIFHILSLALYVYVSAYICIHKSYVVVNKFHIMCSYICKCVCRKNEYAGKNKACSSTLNPCVYTGVHCTCIFCIYINLLFIMNTGFSRTVSSVAKCLFPWQSILQIVVILLPFSTM